MTLLKIQTEIFRQLVGMEPRLKPRYRFSIDKWPSGEFYLKLKDRRHYISISNCWCIDPRTIKTADIHAVIHRIWRAIPAECKKDPLK